MRREIALACVTIGMSASAGQAQDAVPNLVPTVAPSQATFTPDVARDLAAVRRIRVELAFQGDTWTFLDARTEMGVPATYPDAEGFLRAEAVDGAGERLASIGVPDPRILRIYELSAGPDVTLPTIGRREPVRVPPIAIDRPAELSPSPRPSASMVPGPVERVEVVGRARRQFGQDRFDEQALRRPPAVRFPRLEAVLSVPETRRPPHQEVVAPDGTVIVYLPDRDGACAVRITIGASPAPITLNRPVLDLEGQRRACR